MTAEGWMQLAAFGDVSRLLIPMGYQPTLPELYLSDQGWRLRFFYYGVDPHSLPVTIRGPGYQLEFSLDSERPVFFTELPETAPLMGTEGLFTLETANQSEAYLSGLEAMLTAPVKDAESLYSRWLAIYPEELSAYLRTLTRANHKNR